MTKPAKRRAGRPRRDDIDIARTTTWAWAALHQSGLSQRALDKRFGGASSGIWSRYSAGVVAPSEARVAAVEEIYPGTARYYLSPMWAGMRPHLLGKQAPRTIFECLDEPLRSRFIQPPSGPNAIFWRREGNPGDDLNWLMEVTRAGKQPFDVATALVAMTNEAALMQNRSYLAACSEAWAGFFRYLSLYPMGYMPDDVLEYFGRSIYECVRDHPFLQRRESVALKVFGD